MKIFQKVLLTGLLLSPSLIFADGVSIENPYVREVPPGQPNSASFMTLTNDTNVDIALIKASSDVAPDVELHEHVDDDGLLKMRQIPKIIIPANGTTILKPGGLHVMLIGLNKTLKSGDNVEITLEFDNGTKQTINADVKKILMGMMKNKSAMMMKVKQHVNPMPNLMRVYKKMPAKLNLSAEQVVQLDAGIKERGPIIKELTATVMKIEKEIQQASLNDAPLQEIDQLANNLMHERLAIIKGKTYCRESAKKVLDKKQFKTLVKLYRENYTSKPKMNKKQAKMAMNKHTNPMPNLMMVVKKMSDKLNLDEKQAAELKQWSDERGPVMAKQFKAVIKLEADLQEAALNNEPAEKLALLADAITQERIRIIRGKALCRNNMKRILDDKQYTMVKDLYKKHFSSQKM